MGEFVRDRLPEPKSYFESQGLVLAGGSQWRTTRCEFHGGRDSMRINLASGGWRCMSCDEKGCDVLAYHRRVHDLSFVEAARDLSAYDEDDDKPQRKSYRDRPAKAVSRPVAPQQRKSLSYYGRALWRDCEPIAGPALDYLKARACAIPPEDGDLRWHRALRHPCGHVGPALVALVTDAKTREPMTLHRTWIGPGGQKAAIDAPRLLLGGHSKAGGVIRLWPDEAVTTSVAVAEGIESTLTLAHAHQPAWSLIDAANLAAFPVLAGIEYLLIGTDHDKAGKKAAHECATRWHAAGVHVYPVVPPQEGTDLNDIAKEAA